MELSQILKNIEDHPNSKSNHELIWAHYFIFHLNNEKSFDYEVEKGPNDLTDVYARSKSSRFPELKLQLTWALEKDFSPKTIIKDLKFSTGTILKTVERKYEKYSRQGKSDLLKKVILVIQGDLPRGWNDLVDDEDIKREIAGYPFLGIYYVTPPVLRSSIEDRTPISDNGFIISFKDPF
jgi:hypothetical protein